jgi:transposase
MEKSDLRSLISRMRVRSQSRINLELLWVVLEKKEELAKEILRIGEPLKEEVELLITIRGITPLTALAFLADVGEIGRFKKRRKMNAYLGQVTEDEGKRREEQVRAYQQSFEEID